MKNKCDFCGSELVETEPHYIPIGDSEVLEITDQTCPNCGGVVVGPYQKKRLFENQKLHNKLVKLMDVSIHK